MRAFILKMMACRRIMHNRISNEARRAKRNEWVHLRRKVAQLLAYIERLSGGREPPVRLPRSPAGIAEQPFLRPSSHRCPSHKSKSVLTETISLVFPRAKSNMET
jgi:hypothetical protein